MSDKSHSVDPPDAAFILPVDELLETLNVDPASGLDPEEAASRLEAFGPNRIRESKRTGGWRILLNQFKSVVILILVAAGVLAGMAGEVPELIAVALVVAVNTALGFFTEWKAVRTMEALQKLGQTRARVRRGGEETEIDSTEVVPGDLLVLGSGNFLAADARVVETDRLSIDEAALTGESVPVSKDPNALEDPDTPLAERTCMVYKGTTVTDGDALAVVTATGMHTELGAIARQTREAESSDSPLQESMDRLGSRLAWITLLLAAGVAGLGLWSGKDLRTVLETSIALGVAAIPEGLPIVATIALAHGMWLMAKHNVVMNRLTAVETLGSTRIIFTDKTGTLTQNSMKVRRVMLPDGEEHKVGEDGELPEAVRKVLQVGVLCNNADLEEESGDPMETALLRAGRTRGMVRTELLAEMPEQREVDFDRETMMMCTVHKLDGEYRYAVKGAPEAVLKACGDIDDLEKWLKRADRLAAAGLRVLGFAEKTGDSPDQEAYRDLSFLGLMGMEDPVREDVKEPLSVCRRAGIRVIMVTGDQPATAKAIAKELGLLRNEGKSDLEIHTGRDIQGASEEELTRMIENAVGFARVSPKQKLELVSLFQHREDTVAMTGDGVNDSPALKQADIGIAMGRRGTDAAKEASEMILRDDAFASIVKAVRQGRIIFKNIRKSVMFMLCTNLSEIFAVGVGSVTAAGLPLTAMQILFLNMLTDVFPALALGIGKGSSKVMDEPPRPPGEAILTRIHWLTILIWALVVGGTVLAVHWFASGPMAPGERESVTFSFLTLGFAKLWFVFNLRDEETSLWNNSVLRNPWVWASIVFCAMLLVGAVYTPAVSGILSVRPPALRDWGIILGMSAVPLVLGQIWIEGRKIWTNR